MDAFSHIQDVLGQLPFLKTYSHLLLCFPIANGQSQEAIVESLTTAALKLTETFPWLAGKVIHEGGAPGTSGLFKVVPCSRWAPPNTILRVKDCTDCCASYDEIVAARGPISLLDGRILAPRRAFPESYDETDADPAPVLALQANFVRGGVLLDCAAQHNILDMTGIEQCFRLLATSMRGEPFPALAIEQGNRDRRNIVPLLGPEDQMMDHSHFKRSPLSGLPHPVEDSPFSWRYYRFSRSNLAQLKALAMQNTEGYDEDDDDVSYISTNDALSAFCWKRITSVRLRRRGTTWKNATTKFCRAVNARQAMGVPQEYMGDLVTIATSRLTMHELAYAPLSTVARTMRRDLLAVNNSRYIRSFATFIATEPDRSTISYGGGDFDPDTDIGSSSWAHVRVYGEQFGTMLGKPALVRRPDFVPLRSDVYFMPRTEGGDVDALLCLNQVDFEGLERDEEWNVYAESIG